MRDEEATRGMRAKTAVIIVLAMLASAMLLFSVSYQRARDSLSAHLEHNHSVVAEKYAQELTAWVNTNATKIDLLAAEITASGVYAGDREAFQQYLSSTLGLINEAGYIYDLYFTYPDNTMACASGFVPDGSVDYAHDRDWFFVAAETGELFYSTPYRDSDTYKPVVTISKAVYQNNTLQGVLAADIFVDVLVNIIREADTPADSYAFLVDQNLGMVAHPNEAYAFDDEPLGVMDVDGAPYAEVVRKIRSGSSETVYLDDYDGVARGIVVAKMANTGWSVGIATSKEELLGDTSTLMRSYLIVAIVTVMVGGAVAFLIAHALNRVSRRRLTQGVPVFPFKRRGANETVKPRHHPLSALLAGRGMAGRNSLRLPIVIIFLLMVCMVLYTSHVIRDVSVANTQEVGEDRISAEAAQLESYLTRAKSSLWVTADTVDYMLRDGASTRDVSNYLTEETEHQTLQYDENYTGFYALVGGEYVDGLGWEPPQNYDPRHRDWYVSAIEAQGDISIVPPYVDAQTGSIVISIGRMLTNGTDVVSLDVTMNEILQIVSELHIKGKGYGFIVDQDGVVIAHQDAQKQGGLLTDDEQQLALFDKILEEQNGTFAMTVDGQDGTVFVRQVMDQWYMVIVLSNSELLAEVLQQVTINVLICVVIFVLIALIYYMGRKREQNYSQRIEEMRAEEQRQSYAAQVLKLEKEAADQANQAKSDFLADMSHEIRTPINAVLGMNEMVLRESHTAQGLIDPTETVASAAFGTITGYARNIDRAGKNLLSIVNDILDFSKIEAGKFSIVEAPYKLSSLLGDLNNMFRFKANEKGLQFAMDVDETLPDDLVGDEVHVRQVVTNILNNAVKYTPSGGVRMDVRSGEAASWDVDKTMRLVIAITDTGIGIRPEDIDKLFSKFQRVDLNVNSTVEGTGLGLAITQNLLTMMGGSIAVESTYGVGSTFTITLPQGVVSNAVVGNIQARFEEHQLQADVYRESFHAPDARILIVDDTPMNITVAVGLLKSTQMHLDTASSGEEALSLTATNAYDLVLLDQRMPKMDGVTTLRRIRAQGRGANRTMPVICLTADAVTGAKERYLAEGFTDYLTKPLDSQALERMLMQHLPAEKITVVQARDADATKRASTCAAEEDFAALRTSGVDPAVGLRYCENDEELYRALLQEYAQSASHKAQEIEQYFDARDWENYAIAVHALKSSSKTIGAQSLFEVAKRLEAAADAGREDVIVAEHGAMISLYERISAAIRSVVPQELSEPSFLDDEVVFDFIPEDEE